jgi:hypothetical protein
MKKFLFDLHIPEKFPHRHQLVMVSEALTFTEEKIAQICNKEGLIISVLLL